MFPLENFTNFKKQKDRLRVGDGVRINADAVDYYTVYNLPLFRRRFSVLYFGLTSACVRVRGVSFVQSGKF